MDVVYFYKHSADGGFEIRHSLRSLERHAPFVRKVWIFGDRPDFIASDVSRIEHVPHEPLVRIIGAKAAVENFFLQMVLSSFIPDLTNEYLLFSDDFFLLKDWSLADARKDRYIEDMRHVKNRRHDLFGATIWRTFDTLLRLGYPGYNFETHVPAFMTKKRVLAAYCDLRDFVTEDRWYGLLGLTAVLNHALKHEGMPLTNVHEENSRCGFWTTKPTYDEVILNSEGRFFFNFDEEAYGDAIRKFLSERFAEKSGYEKA